MAHCSSPPEAPLLLLLLACAPPDKDTGPAAVEGCLGPSLWEPIDGSTWTFRHPTVAWSRVSAATEYTVTITDSAGSVWKIATTQETSWRPELDTGGTFTVSVTAAPGGETCGASYTVRTLGDAPAVESPTLTCGAAAATASAWALAVSGGEVFTTVTADDGGICAYDAETLAYTESFGSAGPSFRTYGIAADPDGTLYYDTFPLFAECGDTMKRLGVVAPGSRDVTWVGTGMEAGVSVAVAGGLVFETGLSGVSCYGTDSSCLDLDEPCPNGAAEFTAYDLGSGANRFHTEDQASPGLAADDARVYRAGPEASVVVTDLDGAVLFETKTAASPRGLVRYDAPDGRFLLVTDFDQGLHVYELSDGPVEGPEDVVEVTSRALPDRYWQGAVDDQGRFYWPGQLTGHLARWDLQ